MTEQKQLVYPTTRRIQLASPFGQFLHEIGYTGGHKQTEATGKRVRKQLLRLLNARANSGATS